MENEKYIQLCVWPGIILEDDEGEISNEKFEAWFLEEFKCRIKFQEEVKTLPDMEGGVPVPDTGDRNDVLFTMHIEDVPKFVLPRLRSGIKWWSDFVDNGGKLIYPESVIEKYNKSYSN